MSSERVRQVEERLVKHFQNYLDTHEFGPRDFMHTGFTPTWTRDRLLQHIAAGHVCPQQAKRTAYRLRTDGLIVHVRDQVWTLTEAGRAHLGRTT